MKQTKDRFRKDIVKGILRRNSPDTRVLGSREHNYLAAACRYAAYTIGKRWYLAEPLIKENDLWWGIYCKNFDIKERAKGQQT